jgi:hypothetical protein
VGAYGDGSRPERRSRDSERNVRFEREEKIVSRVQ